jgi:hypothetical protein
MAAASGRWGGATARLALLGATVGVALDAIHTHTGTTAYTTPWILRMAWWVPPLFAGAAVAIGLGRPIAMRLAGGAPVAPAPRRVALAMALFVVAYALSGLLPLPNAGVALVLLVVFAITWTLCDGTPLGIGLAVAAAIGGTLVEATLVAGGAFRYTAPDVGGVAVWLPALYVTAGVAVGLLGSLLVER